MITIENNHKDNYDIYINDIFVENIYAISHLDALNKFEQNILFYVAICRYTRTRFLLS